jgi:hypothetical protein
MYSHKSLFFAISKIVSIKAGWVDLQGYKYRSSLLELTCSENSWSRLGREAAINIGLLTILYRFAYCLENLDSWRFSWAA